MLSPRRHSRARAALISGAAIAVVAIGLLVHFGVRKAVWYDDFWHVFIARQEHWASFWREVKDSTHPPVFYLLLKVAIRLLGDSILAYRAVSIAAIAISIVLFARVATRLTGNPALAAVGAAAFGLSTCTLEMGLEVRAYAVFLVLLLSAFSAYLDWLGARPGRARPRTRALFAGAMSLALVTHYSGFFFLGAAAATPLVLFAIHRSWRVRIAKEVREHPLGLAAMFGVPLITAAVAYLVHVRALAHGIGHVDSFMLHRQVESVPAFVARTTLQLAGLFAPHFGTSSSAPAVLVIALFAALAIATVVRGGRGRVTVAPLVVFLLMLGANVLAALAGRYPYGGELRHEIFLFPFAVLCLCAGLERARCAVPTGWASNHAWVATAGLLVVAGSALGVASFAIITEPLGQHHMTRFRREIGTPPAILVDQYNFIVVFAQFHRWSWHLRWQAPGQRMWQVWDLSRGDERLEVCRDHEWQLNLSRPEAYRDIGDCLSRARVARVGVFRSQQDVWPVEWTRQETPALALAFGSKEGLLPEATIVDGNDVYASFARAEALGVPADERGSRPAVDSHLIR